MELKRHDRDILYILQDLTHSKIFLRHILAIPCRSLVKMVRICSTNPSRRVPCSISISGILQVSGHSRGGPHA
jgi:hypothetical protein